MFGPAIPCVHTEPEDFYASGDPKHLSNIVEDLAEYQRHQWKQTGASEGCSEVTITAALNLLPGAAAS